MGVTPTVNGCSGPQYDGGTRYGPLPWGVARAAVLLQMFVATTPLTDSNGLVGSALAIRYLRESGEPVKPPAGGITQPVTGLRNGTLALREVAAQLRAWAR
ncbi:hypothetical protein ACFYWY_10825 [Streptomyces sp. NPDC002870]|uniref:hypothetical protein n=1 Tax=Streptomyces sp. NPDC002870 TaxID=3364666 RepID=UPI0036CEA19B